MKVLENIRSNPYGIKNTAHLIIRSRDRFVNLDLIYKKVYREKPVAIIKDANESSRFLLIYRYNNRRDLSIGIDILNEDEIILLTVIDTSIERMKH